MIYTRCLKWSKNYIQLTISRGFQNALSPMLCLVTNTKKNLDADIVWLDMEMTGLDTNTCHILEIACLITDKNLNVISKDLNVVVHQPDEILNNMNEWCLKTHQKTGLIHESKSSKIMLQDAEEIVLKYLSTYVKKGICPLAGSSVYMDRMFLHKYMPLVNDYLHYRIIDTSTIKELIKRWNIDIPSFPKRHKHRALADIEESIRELKHYKKHIFDLSVKS